MTHGTGNNRRAAYWLKTLSIGFGLTLCVLSIAGLTREVVRKLDALETANSDNVQWTLSQLEVEFLQLQMVLREARDGSDTALRQVRRRFDIFYSRYSIVNEGAIYADLKGDPGFAEALVRIGGFLDDTVPLIDGPRDALAAELIALEITVSDLREDVRGIALSGLDQFARLSDRNRLSVADTLLRLATLTAALVLALSMLSFLLLRATRLSEMRAAEQRLTASRLQTILATSLDAVLVVDQNGIIRAFNGAAERIFGFSETEALGRAMAQLIIPGKYRVAHEAGMKRYLENGENRVIGAGRIELEALRKDGTVFPVELSIDVAEDADGALFVSYLRDITDRKQAEAELVDARDKALAGEKAKAEFLAVMSHEMRTPLNGLLGTLGLLRDSGLTPKQTTYADIMDTTGQLLLHHVNDVLDISKYEAGKIEIAHSDFRLDALLEDLVESQKSIAKSKGITLSHLWVTPPQTHVRGDPMRLKQVLLNLLGNALKFTQGGDVTVEAETVEHGSQGLVVEFRVADTGIGIPEDDLERIFGDFETLDSTYGRQTGGTGLGLGIARRLVHAMGGEIGAESVEGEGSLFWVRVPLEAHDGAPADEESKAAGVAAGRALDLLIVEDNPINRVVLREMLEREGHSVTEAEDGAQGVEMARSHRYDALLMDISMPVMDGVAATRAIRDGDGASRAAPILAVTAHAMPADLDIFRKAGMSGHLTKPITRQALVEKLGRHAGASGQCSPVRAKLPASHLIDRVTVRLLREQLGDAALRDLIARFFDEADQIVARNVDGAADRPLDQVIAELHSLAGSAGALGASGLQAALASLQTLGKSGREDAMRAGLGRLEQLWSESRAELARVIDA